MTNQQYFEQITLPALKDLFEVEENDNFVKVKGGGLEVDFYPESGRMFMHKSGRWHKVLKENVLREIKLGLR